MNDATTRLPNSLSRLPFWSFQFRTGDQLAIRTRKQFETALIRRAKENHVFRRSLIENPKATLEQMLEERLPEDLAIRVLEEDGDHIYLVVPANPYPELTDSDLRSIVGMSSLEIARWVCQNHIGGADWGFASLVARAWMDEAFRRSLQDSPRQALSQVMHDPIPETVTVTVLFETSEVLYLVLDIGGVASYARPSLLDSDLAPYEITAIGTLTTGNCFPSQPSGTGCRCITNSIFTFG